MSPEARLRTARSRAASGTIAALLLSVGCVRNPCPEGMREDRSRDRCVDEQEASAADASAADADTTPPPAKFDAGAPRMDAGDAHALDAEPSASDAEATPDVVQRDGAVGSVDPPTETGSDASSSGPPESGPKEPASRWPAGVVSVCWTAETTARADFATLSARVEAAVRDGWSSASAARIEGWRPCPKETGGILQLALTDDERFEVSDGFAGPTGQAELTLGTRRHDLWSGALQHAFGHVLGLAMGMHDHAPCTAGESAPTMMDARGLCRGRPVITRADRRLAIAAYGPRPVGRPMSFDGDRTSDLLLLTASAGQQAPQVEVVLSTGRGLGELGSGVWAQLTEEPAAIHAGDFDGDGLIDLGLVSSDPPRFEVRFSTGDRFEEEGAAFRLELPTQSKLLVGNFDGAAGADVILMQWDGAMYRYLTGPQGFSGRELFKPANDFGAPDGLHAVGELNGDYVDDLLYFQAADAPGYNCHGASVRNTVWSLISVDGTHPWSVCWLESDTIGHAEGAFYVARFGSDQVDDLAFFDRNTGQLSVMLVEANSASLPTPWAAPSLTGTRGAPRFVGDFDGDGRADLGHLEGNHAHVLLSNGQRLVPAEGFHAEPISTGVIRTILSSRDALAR